MTSLGSVPDGVPLALDDSDSKFMPPKKTTIEAVASSHVTVFPNSHFPFPFTAPRMGDLPFSCLPPTAWESSAWEPTGFQCRSPPPIHGFHLTPRIRRAMGLANNTSTTSKPRQPSSRATTTNTETFAVANSSDNRPGTKATWKTASSYSPISTGRHEPRRRYTYSNKP